VEQRVVEARGLRVAALVEGPDDGPLALCLHGFPDTPHTWRHLLPALARRGYRAVAPWLRGYAPTGPAPDGRYDLGILAGDAAALHDALGADDRAILIGHDWGACIVYSALLSEPGRWSRAVAMAVPMIAGGGLELATPGQMRRSWYSFLFQLPALDDVLAIVAADDLRLVERLWADWSPGYAAAEDVEGVRQALRPDGCLEAAVTYYRHNATSPPDLAGADAAQARIEAIPTPLLYLHGVDDGCLGVELLDAPRACFPAGAHVERVAGAGHFLQLERPDEVERLVSAFLAEA
jgi:pimeloyl-ACP methyl ester carboxylesterase